MADYVTRYTSKASDELEKRIKRVYKQAAEEVQKKLDDFIREHKARNAQMLQMVADGKMSKQDYQRWMRGQVFQGDQWKQKLKDVTEVYVHADEKAREIVGGTSKNVFMEAANYTAYDLEKGMRGAVAFNVYDAKTVERLLKKDPKMLPEWKIDQPKDYTWNEKRVRNAVAQGIIQGESVEEVGDRLTGELATSNATKMDMFARTAINGAQNAGRMDRLHEAKEMGIEVKKKWLATLDSRTRDTHQALDGQEQPVDEPFVVDGMKIDYPGDPLAPPELSYNCRCTLTYVYPKYQHLQHNHERRDQLNDKNIENMTYYEWLGLASKNDRKQEEPELEESMKKEIPQIAGVKRGEQITLDDIWKPSGDYVPANSQKEFMMNNMAELKAAGVKNSAQIREQYENTAMQTAFERLHKISDQEAVDIARDGIPEGIRNKWFVDADSSVKPKIVDCLMGDPELLNAGWNIAYRNYIETIGDSNVSFEEFMGTPIKMFRGTHGQSEIASDVWVSFSMDRKIAESFGDSIEEILIRPIDTWGSYQTTAEAEILIPKRMLDKLRD